MNPTNEELIQWVKEQTNKKVLRRCAQGLLLSSNGSKKALKECIVAHLETLNPADHATWMPLAATEESLYELSKNVQKSLGLTLISLIFTMILGAIVFVKKDDTGFNRDQIREIVIQTNYDTCVADVEELNSVIPDPAMQLDPAATCG